MDLFPSSLLVCLDLVHLHQQLFSVQSWVNDNDDDDEGRLVSHGGDPSDSAATVPGPEAEGLLMQPDPLGPWLPAGDLVEHRRPGAAAVPGIWSGDGGSWVGHGRSASMETCCCGWFKDKTLFMETGESFFRFMFQSFQLIVSRKEHVQSSHFVLSL